MKIWLKALTAAAVTALVCAAVLSFANRPGKDADSCEIWYIKGDVSDGALNELIHDYNNDAEHRLKGVTARAFDSPEAIDAAIMEKKNSLVICSYDTAERMNDEGKLCASGGLSFSYPDEIIKASPSAGKGFYPFGYSSAVLACDASFSASGIEFRHDTLRELMDTFGAYTEKTGLPCGSTDSIWSILAGELGEEDFTGIIDIDRNSQKFCRCYNLMAEAVYDRSLSPVPGDTLCRIISSRDIKSGDTVYPVPGMKSGDGKLVGSITGFALLQDDPDAVSFLKYAHENGRLSHLASESGMDSTDRKTAGKLNLSEITFPEYDREAVRNRNEFNRKSAQTLDYID